MAWSQSVLISGMLLTTVLFTGCSATSDRPGDSEAIATQVPAAPQDSGVPPVASAQPDSTVPDTGAASSFEPIVDDSLVAAAANVPCGPATERFRDTMVAVINNSRLSARQCGSSAVPAAGLVSWNDQLADAALNHANDMITHNFFSHDGSDGLSVADRADTVGYDWRAIGENIAAGQQEVEEVHDGWLDSAGHCRNIMNALYTEVGAACVYSEDTDFGNYWVVVFGTTR